MFVRHPNAYELTPIDTPITLNLYSLLRDRRESSTYLAYLCNPLQLQALCARRNVPCIQFEEHAEGDLIGNGKT